MNDRELLELAAKAAGYQWPPKWPNPSPVDVPHDWNPLVDDGDALRLAVRKRFHVCIFSATECLDGIAIPGFVEVWQEGDTDPLYVHYMNDSDYEVATRRAIVRAAAEIGRMGDQQ